MLPRRASLASVLCLAAGCGEPAGDALPAGSSGAPPVVAPPVWPLQIGGGPLGDAEPVSEPPPSAREYATRGELIPADQRVPAPSFLDVEGWLNVTRAFRGEELVGRVLVVDFWTAGCINCIHMAPRFAELEARHHGDPFLILGSHSQKFTAEASVESLKKAIQILEIAHPVALDPQHGAWKAWGVGAWPTIFVVDARGRVAKELVGEKSVEALSDLVEGALAEGAAEGVLSEQPLGFLGRERETPSPLRNPEKIAPLEDGWAIADTGHHRVVLTDAGGNVTAVIGDGTPGASDGAWAAARFNAPRGLAARGDVLYVADTENHAVRAVDLATAEVTTLAGTGQKGGRLELSTELDAPSTAISSPWDVCVVGDRLFVALAGSHQIAELDPARSRLWVAAGTGSESLLDAPALEAKLAQPSGLATDGADLFFVDAESSSVRRLDLRYGQVTTLVGKGLKVWGDVDGPNDVARLQHPQGIAWADGALWIADTYNSKLKRVDPWSHESLTVAGSGSHAELFQPGGLAVAPGSSPPRALVADTGNDRIVEVPLAGRDRTPRPWEPAGLDAP